MREELRRDGYEINVVAINQVGAESTQDLLIARCSFDLLQDVNTVDAWRLMAGGKDDIFIYREGSILAPSGFMPAGNSTNLSTGTGYLNLFGAIVTAHDLGSVGCNSCGFAVEKGVASKKRGVVSLKVKRALFDPGISSYRRSGEDIRVLIDGKEYFNSPLRKLRVNRAGNKIRIKERGAKLAINLKHRRIVLVLKKIPAADIDLADGIDISVSFAGATAELNVLTIPRRKRSFLLSPVQGTMVASPEYSPCW